MSGYLGSLFGIKVQVAGPILWPVLCDAARAAGAVELGAATASDEEYEIVLDEKAGILWLNPNKSSEIMERLRAAIAPAPTPEETPTP